MSDEAKKVNNHLIIGLGGTGGKIIREVRRTIASDPGSGNAVNFEYLYVDTSAELMKPDDPTWRVLGRSTQLAQSQQLLIKGADLGELLRDVHAYPNIRPWIEPLDVIKGLAKTNVDSAQGGQRRKFGRFLFASASRDFIHKLGDRVETLRKKNSSSALTFHVCTGLAGGTGSGSVVDVVAQIRNAYPSPEEYRILIYALLPDEQPKANWNSGNYHANGYAALMELNALAVGEMHPHDVAGAGRQLTDLSSPPFNGCYTFCNENEGGVFVDVEAELPKIVGDFIYQKTLGLGWAGLSRAENSENGNKDDERSLDTRRAERSKRFLTFGIRRLVVPKDEIREYLSYNFAVQAARQLMFNNWIEGMGYGDEPRPASVHEEIASPDTQSRWRITDEHLTLSRGILPQDSSNARWKPVAEYWDAVVSQHKLDIEASVSKKEAWIDELKRRCDQIHSEGYRALGGVRKFYETKLKDKADIARYVRVAIDEELFRDWKNGKRSLSEISKVLAALSSHLEERASRADERISKLRSQEEAAMSRVSEVVQESASLNWVMDMLGKGKKLFNQAAEHLTQLYVIRTYAEGWLFAKKLLEELNQQVIELRTEVERSLATLAQAAERFGVQLKTRLADQSSEGGGHRQRVYNRDAVLAVNKRLTTDEDTQKQQAQAARTRLIGMLGEDHQGFSSLNRRVDAATLESVLEECSEEQAVAANAVLGTDNSQVLNMNIIDKLYDEYGANDEALATFVRKTIAHAGVYLTFDGQEERKQGLGTDNELKRIKTTGLFLPAAKHRVEFRNKLQQLFEQNKTSPAFDVLTEGTKENEITLIRVDNLFPIRFAKPTKFLRRKYEERCAASRDARFLLHGEGDGSALPPLFITDLVAETAKYRPTLMLARAFGLVQDRKSPSSGRLETVFRYEDDDGLEQEEVLGKSFVDVANEIQLGLELLNAIDSQVGLRLRSRDLQHEDTKRDIVRKVSATINEVKASCGGDLQDPLYIRFKDSLQAVKARLGLE